MAMKCVKCGAELESRSTTLLNDTTVRRRKVCPNCGYFIFTIEIPMSEYEDMAGFFNGFVQLLSKYAPKSESPK
jgi:DNA-directed RNA polymerase subunit RPC12/RpoP